jgi:protein-S-isoprenylcysteine O-methyltransferase Ste14
MAATYAMGALWGLWLLSWAASARYADLAVRKGADPGEGLARVLTVAGFLILFWSAWPRPPSGAGTGLAAADWALVAVSVSAFAFCWWARIHLGRLWAIATSVTAAHRIVDTGPYALVRHPIYTGIILACAALALFQATPGTWLGAALVTVGFWVKARVEERFLTLELGAEAYGAYVRRVPMLVPFLKRG